MIVAVPLLWLPIHQCADTPDFRQSDPVANTRPSPLPELRLAAQFLYPLYRPAWRRSAIKAAHKRRAAA